MTDDRLAEIVNDIAEGIDNGETRAELREALAKCQDELAREKLSREWDLSRKQLEQLTLTGSVTA